MTNGTVTEGSDCVLTATYAVPGRASLSAVTVAVRCVLLPTMVGSGCPFQSATVEAEKPAPPMSSVMLSPPAGADAGLMDCRPGPTSSQLLTDAVCPTLSETDAR